MTVLKYDDVIKKITQPWFLFWYFLKDHMEHYTQEKFHSQGLLGLGFVIGRGLCPSKLSNVEKA